jgi:hypothetical protein
MNAAIIEKEALLLPEADRARLADRLLASIAPDSETDALRQQWIRESEDRMDAYLHGKLDAVDGPQAMAMLRKRFAP